MTYIIRNGAAEFPDDQSFAIGGAAFVVAENFVGFKPEDFEALDPYIHFSRPFVRIDTFSEIYRDFNTTLLSGFRKQQEINDLQNSLLLGKIDEVRVENVPLPVVEGTVDLPMAAPEGQSINPLYVNHWPSLAALNAGTTVTDYVDLDAEPQVSLGYFAFDNGTGKVAIPTLKEVQGLISAPLKNIVSKLQEPETGSGFTSITFPDNLWADMIAHPNGAGEFEVYIWDQAIDIFTSVGVLEVVLFDFGFFDIPDWAGGVEMHGYGIISSGNWNTANWSYEISGVTVSWDYPTKTMSFSAPVGGVLPNYMRANMSETFAVYSIGDPDWAGGVEMHGYGIISSGKWNTANWSYEISGVTVSWDYPTKTISFSAPVGGVLSDYMRQNMSDTFAVYSIGDVGETTSVGEWDDTEYDTGDPAYQRLIQTTESVSGLLSGTRLTSILKNAGDLSELETTDKASLVAAINELKARIDAL
jgi:hypothetical protein